MNITDTKIDNALESLENLAKGDQGANPPLNSAEGDDLGVKRGKPMSDAAKEGKANHGKSDYSDKGKEKKMTKKSFKEELPDEITEQIDVSDFLKSLVDYTGEKMDELNTQVAKSELAQSQTQDDITSKLETIEKSQAMIGIVLKSVCEKLGIIENAPAHAQKSETSINKSEVAERKFDSNAAEGNEGVEEKAPLFKSLSKNPQIAKSQVSEAMCDLVKSGECADTDVINFEMTGFISPTIVSKLNEKLN
jgi:hypothetical protein